MEVLTRLAAQYENHIGALAGPLIMARELALMDEMIASGQTSMAGRGTLSACNGVFNELAVLHDGTIVPCNILSSLYLGKIGIDNLQEIWLNHPILVDMRQRQEIPLSSLETCQDCTYQGFCTGGCPAGALYACGSLNARNPMSCYRVIRDEDPFFKMDDILNISKGEKNG